MRLGRTCSLLQDAEDPCNRSLGPDATHRLSARVVVRPRVLLATAMAVTPSRNARVPPWPVPPSLFLCLGERSVVCCRRRPGAVVDAHRIPQTIEESWVFADHVRCRDPPVAGTRRDHGRLSSRGRISLIRLLNPRSQPSPCGQNVIDEGGSRVVRLLTCRGEREGPRRCGEPPTRPLVPRSRARSRDVTDEIGESLHRLLRLIRVPHPGAPARGRGRRAGCPRASPRTAGARLGCAFYGASRLMWSWAAVARDLLGDRGGSLPISRCR